MRSASNRRWAPPDARHSNGAQPSPAALFGDVGGAPVARARGRQCARRCCYASAANSDNWINITDSFHAAARQAEPAARPQPIVKLGRPSSSPIEVASPAISDPVDGSSRLSRLSYFSSPSARGCYSFRRPLSADSFPQCVCVCLCVCLCVGGCVMAVLCRATKSIGAGN